MIELNDTTRASSSNNGSSKMKNTLNNLRARIPQKSESLLSSQTSGGDSNSRLPTKDPVLVEPKTYFANERTFIQWISAALLLLTVSSIMMGSGNYNGTSSVIAFSSLVLVMYASYVYFRRVKLLRSGDAYGYLDFVGPSILAVGVGVGVFIVFADAVKGSEFLPWGTGDHNKDYDNDRRRSLVQMQMQMQSGLQVPAGLELAPQLPENPKPLLEELEEQVDGKCSRYAIDGINLLEYQPRDIILNANANELIVATPQALVSHPLHNMMLMSDKDDPNALGTSFLKEIPDMEIIGMTMVGDNRLFALSTTSSTTGPSFTYKTELIEFNANNKEIESRFLIKESTSTAGSMVFVPSSSSGEQEENKVKEEGKLYIYLDGTMHRYELHKSNSNSLHRMSTINMKVLNRSGGGGGDKKNDDDPITAMEHFEGLTYMLRERQNTIQAWDLNTATLIAEMPLPITVSKDDKWVGMAFQRRRNDDEEEEEEKSFLRNSKKMDTTSTTSAVYLHMPLDTFPPQLWSFRLEEEQVAGEQDDDERNIFTFPVCGVATN